MITLEHNAGGLPLQQRENLVWEKFLRRGFSPEALQGAKVGALKKPLQDKLVGFEAFANGKLMQVEVYKGRRGLLSARLYFQPTNEYVPTYIVTTQKGLEALQKTESKLLEDPILEGEVIRGRYGEVNLRSLAQRRQVKALMSQLLQQDNLVYAERKTTHVYTGRDVHRWMGLRRVAIRMFTDRVNPASEKYTALVFRKNGKPLQKGVGALNVTNDRDVVAHRPKTEWTVLR